MTAPRTRPGVTPAPSPPRHECDLVNVGIETAEDCPGIAGHCARGEHCTSTDAGCAACANYDHASTCESCGAPLSTGGTT